MHYTEFGVSTTLSSARQLIGITSVESAKTVIIQTV